MSEIDPKLLAERIHTRIDRQQSFVGDQVASMAKWLMASLLAVNGAGALAVANGLASNPDAWIAGLVFAFGTAAALLSGAAMQEVYNAYPEPLLEMDNYWLSVASSGERDSEAESIHETKIASAGKFSFLPPAFGWVSGLLFLTGALMLTFDAETKPSPVCDTLRRDMLSARPQRGDGIELYQALHCEAKRESIK